MIGLAIGAVLHGSCDGFFDDSYGCKRVEGFGADWIVAREIDTLHNSVVFAWFEHGDTTVISRQVAGWLKPLAKDTYGSCDECEALVAASQPRRFVTADDLICPVCGKRGACAHFKVHSGDVP